VPQSDTLTLSPTESLPLPESPFTSSEEESRIQNDEASVEEEDRETDEDEQE
jgi:hypothetical protein